MTNKLVFGRMPQDDDELWEWVALVWGFEIPRSGICPGHSAPFDAFAEAYFARTPVSIWKASRGLGGKSTLLGILAITEAVTLGAQISVLGGSAQQSQRVHDVTKEAWFSEWAPSHLLRNDPTLFFTNLKNGAWIKALMASQTSVRGPHPQRLRLDEIDEMDLPILEAAQGQPMETSHRDEDTNAIVLDVSSQTVMSSTHQYPDKTMSAILRRAREKDWPVHQWCYKENHEMYGGWLTQRQIDAKKAEISEAMFAIEFDLQEPSFEGRAIDTDFVELAFKREWGEFTGAADENIIIEQPIKDSAHPVYYVTGADWAKESDWTIIATFRATPLPGEPSNMPWKCVAWRRTGRRPWPMMVGYLQDRLDAYGGLLCHDATGLGDVIHDLLDYESRLIDEFKMVGAERTNTFSDYIKAIETQEIAFPHIEYPYTEHLYVTLDDLFGSSSKGHPPDSVVAGACAWRMRKQVHKLLCQPTPISISRDASPWRTM